MLLPFISKRKRKRTSMKYSMIPIMDMISTRMMMEHHYILMLICRSMTVMAMVTGMTGLRLAARSAF